MLPYTAQELESASHLEELPPVRFTVVKIYGAMRGGVEEMTAGARRYIPNTA